MSETPNLPRTDDGYAYGGKPGTPEWPGETTTQMPGNGGEHLVAPVVEHSILEDPAAFDRLTEAVSARVTAEARSLSTTVLKGGRQHLSDAEKAATQIKGAAAEAAQQIVSTAEKTAANTAGQVAKTGEQAIANLNAEVAEARKGIQEDFDQIEKAVVASVGELREVATATQESADRATEAANGLMGMHDDKVRTAVTQVLEAMRSNPEELAVIRDVASKLGPRHYNTPLLKALVKAGIPAYLHGESGSGKSTAAKITAADFGVDFRAASLSAATTKADLLGFTDANGVTRHTGMRHILEAGGVFLFDEMDAASPNAMTVLNATLANGATEFPDTRLEHHPHARFVAAANTIGAGATAQFVGRNRLDAATLDRFAFLQWNIDERLEDYLGWGDSDLPEKVIDLQAGGVPTPKEWTYTVRAYREELARDKVLATPRATEYGKRLIDLEIDETKVGLGYDHLVKLLIHKGANPTQTQKWDQAVKRKLEGFRRANPRPAVPVRPIAPPSPDPAGRGNLGFIPHAPAPPYPNPGFPQMPNGGPSFPRR